MSARDGQSVSEYERQYKDGSDPRVLDIVEVPLLHPQPCDHQAENWLLDPEHYWERVGHYSPFDLSSLTDPVEPLWVDGYSTHRGRNDRIPLAAKGETSSSLRFIAAKDVVLEVTSPGEAFGNSKRRVQGQFVHAGRTYALWVTDPLYELRYLAKLDGIYRIGECHLTVSLGKPYQDTIFKLIAAVIERDGRYHRGQTSGYHPDGRSI